MSDAADTPKDVHHLRRAWKPHKERLNGQQDGHPTPIRFHRACSWLQRVETMGADIDLDLALTCQWIAFNALYGQWNDRLKEPCSDRQSWVSFLDRVLELDVEGRLAALLTAHKKLVLAILDDVYLAEFFWRDPSQAKAHPATRDRRQAPGWYVEARWGLILEHLVDRIYLLRCQLLHGSATYNSRLNRKSLGRCVTMMGHLLPAVLTVWVDRGADEDCGPMCHPPVG